MLELGGLLDGFFAALWPGVVESFEGFEATGVGGFDGLLLLFDVALEGEFLGSHEGLGERGGGAGLLLDEGIDGAAEGGKAEEHFAERGRDGALFGESFGMLKLEEVAEAGGRVAKGGEGGVELGGGAGFASQIGMRLSRGAMERLLEVVNGEPGAAGLAKRGEVVGHW